MSELIGLNGNTPDEDDALMNNVKRILNYEKNYILNEKSYDEQINDFFVNRIENEVDPLRKIK